MGKIILFTKSLIFLLLSIIIPVSSCFLDKSPLTIGLVPTESPEKLIQEFHLMEEYLEKEMGRPIEVYIPADYRELIIGMEDGKVDIGLFGAFSYIIADSRQDLTPLLVRKKKNYGITYNSLIISLKESSLSGIEDLKGKKVAFVDSASTSGYIIPQTLFLSRNIDIGDFFGSSYFAGSHDMVIQEVLEGKCDAGAVSNTILSRLIAQGKVDREKLKILWQSESIPGSPYAARENLPSGTVRHFMKAMQKVHMNAPEALEAFDSSIEKYIPIEKGMYNPIRNIVNILGKDFFEENYL